MKYKNILITGGAGFVGSNLAISLKQKYPQTKITCLDNLSRRGSELNLTRLKQNKIVFNYGDIRQPEDLNFLTADLIIDCSAEPSVLAGITNPYFLINNNLIGTINCLELARIRKSDFIFLSSSRVYSIKELNRQKFKAVAENFPLGRVRSLYGTTKLAAELIIQEYADSFNLKAIINRCGCLAGPWQFGKVDQGVLTLWLAAHYFKKELAYIGFGGRGKQVRDFLHIRDLFEILDIQINHFYQYSGEIYNIGGGIKNSTSLVNLTKICQKITGNKIKIKSIKKNRPNDVISYITDISKIKKQAHWSPQISLEKTIEDTYNWIKENESVLKNILC